MDRKAEGVTQLQSLLGRSHHGTERNELKRPKQNANLTLNMCHHTSTDRKALHLCTEIRAIRSTLKFDNIILT